MTDILALYEQHKNMVYRLALSFLKNQADARIRQTLLRRSVSEQEVTPMKPKKHPIRTLLIAAALVAVLALAAAAVANTYFIPTVQSDLAAADTLQGALGDNIASLMLDESGIGIVTVDIDFPSADMVPEAYSPCLQLYSGSLEGKAVETGASGELGELHGLDCADYRDETQSTDTHIRYVCYLTPFNCADKAGDLVMRFCLIDQVYDAVTGEYTGEGEWYIALNAPELIPAQHYSGDGFEARWRDPHRRKMTPAALRSPGFIAPLKIV